MQGVPVAHLKTNQRLHAGLQPRRFLKIHNRKRKYPPPSLAIHQKQTESQPRGGQGQKAKAGTFPRFRRAAFSNSTAKDGREKAEDRGAASKPPRFKHRGVRSQGEPPRYLHSRSCLRRPPPAPLRCRNTRLTPRSGGQPPSLSPFRGDTRVRVANAPGPAGDAAAFRGGRELPATPRELGQASRAPGGCQPPDRAAGSGRAPRLAAAGIARWASRGGRGGEEVAAAALHQPCSAGGRVSPGAHSGVGGRGAGIPVPTPPPPRAPGPPQGTPALAPALPGAARSPEAPCPHLARSVAEAGQAQRARPAGGAGGDPEAPGARPRPGPLTRPRGALPRRAAGAPRAPGQVQ